MRYLFFVLFLLCVNTVPAQEQAERTQPPAPETWVTIIPVRCAFNDVNVGCAKRIGFYHTLEVRVGYVHPNRFLQRYYEEWLTSTEMNFQGPSVYFQLNRWKYNKKQKRFYYGVIAGYRYLSYEEKALWLGGRGGSSFAEQPVLSQWRNDLLFLVSIGFNSTRYTSSEVSVGFRIMQTHTHVSDTRFHPANMTAAEYDAYRAGQINSIPHSEGITIGPLIRITSRFGWFGW